MQRLGQMKFREPNVVMEKVKSGLGTAFNFLGGLSGMVALLTIAVAGGELRKQVEIDTARISRIEQGGSPGLLAHERMDDERVTDLTRRTVALEEAVKQISDIRGELRSINTKLDMLTEHVKETRGRQ